MKPVYHKIVNGCAVLVIIYTIFQAISAGFFFLAHTDWAYNREKYHVSRDTVEVLGDGRFQVGNIWGGRVLDDSKWNGEALVFDLEKYFIKNPYIYVIGYYSDGLPPIAYLSLKDGERYYYEDEGIGPDEIPRFLILDYKKPELRTYVRLEEVPEEERGIFTLTLKECKKHGMRCWEKEMGQDTT